MSGITYNYSAANAEYSHRYLYPSVSRLLQNVPPGAIVMDAGCGNGSFLSLFQDRNWQLHGSDLSPTGIEIARKTFPNINFFLADGQTLYADFLKTVGESRTGKSNRRSFDCVAHKVREQLRSG